MVFFCDETGGRVEAPNEEAPQPPKGGVRGFA